MNENAVQKPRGAVPVNIQVGDIIQFGRYEQDNDLTNGAEEIEWRVLDIEGDTALIISVMGLDAKLYHKPGEKITWADCSLRAWLNNEFFNAAFNERERERVVLTNVVNNDNPRWKTVGGKNTEDKVFILSIAEAEQYFADDDDRTSKPTAYAAGNGSSTDSDNGNGWWWLRSPGGIQLSASVVYTDGGIYDLGGIVNYTSGSVRPALRIKLE